MINFVLQQKHRNLLKKISLGILGLLGAGVILFLTNLHGVGLTPDSVSYISTARSLAEGNGFTLYNGLYYIAQPPLYPILLFVIKITKFIDPLISAGYVNAALFGFTVSSATNISVP